MLKRLFVAVVAAAAAAGSGACTTHSTYLDDDGGDAGGVGRIGVDAGTKYVLSLGAECSCFDWPQRAATGSTCCQQSFFCSGYSASGPGRCVRLRTAGEACTTPEECVDQSAVCAGPEGEPAKCYVERCTATSECKNGGVCERNLCLARVGDTCTKDGQCQSGACDHDTLTCL